MKLPGNRPGAVALILAGLLSASALSAQASSGTRSNTRGVVLGVHLNGTALKFEDEDTESGGGLGLVLGYGFTKRFMLYLTGDAAKININDPTIDGSYTLAHGDLGARFTFANATRAWIPYLNAAFTVRTASADIEVGNGTQEVSFSGPAFTVGGGVQYFFTPKVALDVGLMYSNGKFNEIKIGNVTVKTDDAESSMSSRANIGLKFYLQSAR